MTTFGEHIVGLGEAADTAHQLAAIESGTGREITYAELSAAADIFRVQLLIYLSGLPQLSSPPTVCLHMHRSIDWYIANVGCNLAGVPIVMHSRDLPDLVAQTERMRHIRESLRPLVVIVDELTGDQGEVHVDRFLTETANNSPSFTNYTNLLLGYQFTGGTTSGTGKCVRILNRMAVHEIERYPSILTRSHPRRILQNASSFWPAAAFGQIDIAVAFAGCLVLSVRGGSSADEIARLVEDYGIDCLGVVPSVLRSIKPSPTVETVFTWGERLPLEIARDWAEKVELIDLLIATEYWLSFYAPIDARIYPWVYKTVPGVIASFEPSEDESSLMLCVGGDSVTEGYTAEDHNEGRFVDGTFRTNDAVVRVSHHGEFTYTGRMDDYVKIGGKFVNLKNAEKMIMDSVNSQTTPHQNSLNCVVFRNPNSLCSLMVCFEIPRGTTPRVSRLVHAVQTVLPGISPGDVHIVEEIPRRPGTGKIDTSALSKTFCVPLEVSSVASRPLPNPNRWVWLVLVGLLFSIDLWRSGVFILSEVPLNLFCLPFVSAAIDRMARESYRMSGMMNRVPSVFMAILLNWLLGPLRHLLALVGMISVLNPPGMEREKPKKYIWIPVFGVCGSVIAMEVVGPVFITLATLLCSMGGFRIIAWAVVYYTNLPWDLASARKSESAFWSAYDRSGNTSPPTIPSEKYACGKCGYRVAATEGAYDRNGFFESKWICETCWWRNYKFSVFDNRIIPTVGPSIASPTDHQLTTPPAMDPLSTQIFAAMDSVGLERSTILSNGLGGLSSLMKISVYEMLKSRIPQLRNVPGLVLLGPNVHTVDQLRMLIKDSLDKTSEESEKPDALSDGAGKYMIQTGSASLWKYGACDWLLKYSGVEINEGVLLETVRKLVRRHPALRAFPKDDIRISNSLQQAIALADVGWLKRSVLWACEQVWPRIQVRPFDPSMTLPVSFEYMEECTADSVMRMATKHRSRTPFVPPFEFVFFLPELDDATEIYVYFRVTHLFSDANCVNTVIAELEQLLDSSGPDDCFNGFQVLQDRLVGTLRGSGQQNLGSWLEDRVTHDMFVQCLWVSGDVLKGLIQAGSAYGLPIEMMLTGIIVASLAKKLGWSRTPIQLMHALRTGLDESKMIGYFADYKDMGWFATGENICYLELCHMITSRIRGQQWRKHEQRGYDYCYGAEPWSEHMFPITFNILSQMQPKANACVTQIPNYWRSSPMYGSTDHRPIHVYMEETKVGEEWSLRFHFSRRFFDCQWIVDYVGKGFREAAETIVNNPTKGIRENSD
jgi:acyl-coenzyme A synthetase/AMP-(fatty) acid ligase